MPKEADSVPKEADSAPKEINVPKEADAVPTILNSRKKTTTSKPMMTLKALRQEGVQIGSRVVPLIQAMMTLKALQEGNNTLPLRKSAVVEDQRSKIIIIVVPCVRNRRKAAGWVSPPMSHARLVDIELYS